MKIRFDVNDAEGRNEFIGGSLCDALGSLATESQPRWGAFTAAQMVEHLLWGFELSTGRRVADAATSVATATNHLPEDETVLVEDEV